jgi:hypothetical protein
MINPVGISKQVQNNHEALWPGYESKADLTDPELIVEFD